MSAEALSFIPNRPIDFENSANVRQSIKLEAGTGGWRMSYLKRNRTLEEKRVSRASVLTSLDKQLSLLDAKEAIELQKYIEKGDETEGASREAPLTIPQQAQSLQTNVKKPKQQSRLWDQSSQTLESSSLDKHLGAWNERDNDDDHCGSDETDTRTAPLSSSSSSSVTPSPPAAPVGEGERAKPTRKCMVRNEAWSDDEDDDSHHDGESIPSSVAPPMDQALGDEEDDRRENEVISRPPPPPPPSQGPESTTKETEQPKKSKKKKKKKRGSTLSSKQSLDQSSLDATSSSLGCATTTTTSSCDDTTHTLMEQVQQDNNERRAPLPRSLSVFQDQDDSIFDSDMFVVSDKSAPIPPPPPSTDETQEVLRTPKQRRASKRISQSMESHNREEAFVSPVIDGEGKRFSDQDAKSKQRLAEIFGDDMLMSLQTPKVRKGKKKEKKEMERFVTRAPAAFDPSDGRRFSDHEDAKSDERLKEIFGEQILNDPISPNRYAGQEDVVKSEHCLAENFGGNDDDGLSTILDSDTITTKQQGVEQQQQQQALCASESRTPPLTNRTNPSVVVMLDRTDKQYSDQDLKSKKRILEIFGDDHFLAAASPVPEDRKKFERRTSSFGSLHSRLSSSKSSKSDKSKQKEDQDSESIRSGRRSPFGSLHRRLSLGRMAADEEQQDSNNDSKRSDRRSSFGSWRAERRSSSGSRKSERRVSADSKKSQRRASAESRRSSLSSAKSSTTLDSYKKFKKGFSPGKKKRLSKKNKPESPPEAPKIPLDDDELIVEGVLNRYTTDQCRSFSDHQEMAEAELISTITNTSPGELRRLKNKLTKRLRARLGGDATRADEEDASVDASDRLIEVYEDDLSDVTSLTSMTGFTHQFKSSRTLSHPVRNSISVVDNSDDDSELVAVRDLAILNGKFTGTLCPISGKPHGQGRIEYFESKGVYNGQWKQGQWSGKGKHIMANRDYYEGQFLDNLYHGMGVFSYTKSGRFFEGQYVMGERIKGTMHYADGSVYRGQFYHGSRHGRGTYTFKDDSRYKGDFYKDLMQGIGELRFRDGSSYVGEWKRGKHEGQGSMFSADGKLCWAGMWKDGKQVFP